MRRIDISERIGIDETNASKECDICHYWSFADKGFKYEPYLCNGRHNLLQEAMNFNDVLIKEVIIKFIFSKWEKMMQQR